MEHSFAEELKGRQGGDGGRHSLTSVDISDLFVLFASGCPYLKPQAPSTARPSAVDGAVDSYSPGTKTKVKTLFTLTGLPLSIGGLKTQLRAASTAALRSAS